MIRLLYFSQASQKISDEQVQEILKSSRRHNPGLGITGVLVHGGDIFMQVLEGPEQKVLEQYVKILGDRRHSNCRIIHISPANERIFNHWSMGNISCDPLNFQQLLKLRTYRLESVHAKEFTNVMRDFIQMLNDG